MDAEPPRLEIASPGRDAAGSPRLHLVFHDHGPSIVWRGDSYDAAILAAEAYEKEGAEIVDTVVGGNTTPESNSRRTITTMQAEIETADMSLLMEAQAHYRGTTGELYVCTKALAAAKARDRSSGEAAEWFSPKRSVLRVEPLRQPDLTPGPPTGRPSSPSCRPRTSPASESSPPR